MKISNDYSIQYLEGHLNENDLLNLTLLQDGQSLIVTDKYTEELDDSSGFNVNVFNVNMLKVEKEVKLKRVYKADDEIGYQCTKCAFAKSICDFDNSDDIRLDDAICDIGLEKHLGSYFVVI